MCNCLIQLPINLHLNDLPEVLKLNQEFVIKNIRYTIIQVESQISILNVNDKSETNIIEIPQMLIVKEII